MGMHLSEIQLLSLLGGERQNCYTVEDGYSSEEENTKKETN
jgi:hypothetical protein